MAVTQWLFLIQVDFGYIYIGGNYVADHCHTLARSSDNRFTPPLLLAMSRWSWATKLTLTAPVNLAVSLHGWHHLQSMDVYKWVHECVIEWENGRQYLYIPYNDLWNPHWLNSGIRPAVFSAWKRHIVMFSLRGSTKWGCYPRRVRCQCVARSSKMKIYLTHLKSFIIVNVWETLLNAGWYTWVAQPSKEYIWETQH